MTTTITLQPEHAYVLASTAALYLTTFVVGATIGGARKRHGVRYPQLYATRGDYLDKDGKVDEKKWEEHGIAFNQHQRGHQHIFETDSAANAFVLTCGLFYPTYTATWAAVWVVGTLAYAYGYAVKPTYRMPGSLFVLAANIAWLYGLFSAGRALHQGKPF